jgi:hypothetical protein
VDAKARKLRAKHATSKKADYQPGAIHAASQTGGEGGSHHHRCESNTIDQPGRLEQALVQLTCSVWHVVSPRLEQTS